MPKTGPIGIGLPHRELAQRPGIFPGGLLRHLGVSINSLLRHDKKLLRFDIK